MKKILTILLTLLSTTCMGMHSDKGKRPLRPRPAATEKTPLLPQTCTICLDILAKQREFLPCGHGFCQTCINHWREAGHNDCPNCRKSMNACWASDIKAPIDQYDDADCHGASSSRRIAPPTAAYHAGVSSPYDEYREPERPRYSYEPVIEQHDIDSDVNPFAHCSQNKYLYWEPERSPHSYEHDDDLVAKTDYLACNVQMYKSSYKRKRLSCCGIYMPTICRLFCCKR